MARTGSTVVYEAVSRGRGLVLACVGILLLVVSATVHADWSMAIAAFLFWVCLVGMRVLALFDHDVIDTPWRRVVRLTDVISLALLLAGTFGPLFLVAKHGTDGYDLMVLSGILLVWWLALDRLLADYRKVLLTLAGFALAWLPVAIFHPPVAEVAIAVDILAALALTHSVFALRHELRNVPRVFRVVDAPGSPPKA